MIACVSRSTRRFLSFVFLAIGDLPRAVGERCEHEGMSGLGERPPHSLRPLQHNEIVSVFHKLIEAERRKVAPLVEPIRINVNEACKWLARKLVDLL